MIIKVIRGEINQIFWGRITRYESKRGKEYQGFGDEYNVKKEKGSISIGTEARGRGTEYLGKKIKFKKMGVGKNIKSSGIFTPP